MTRPNPTPTRTLTTHKGNTLVIEPISAYFRSRLLLQSQRDLRDERPEVPTFQSDFSDKALPNPTDPEYVAAMERWTARVHAQLLAHCIAMATKYTLVDDPNSMVSLATIAEVAEVRHAQNEQRLKDYYAEAGIDAEETQSYCDLLLSMPAAKNVRVQYVVYSVIDRNDDDLMKLLALLQAELELEEAVQSAAESFQSDVSGEVDLEAQSSVVGAAI